MASVTSLKSAFLITNNSTAVSNCNSLVGPSVIRVRQPGFNRKKQLTVTAAVGDLSSDSTTYLIAGAVTVALLGTAFPILFSRKDTRNRHSWRVSATRHSWRVSATEQEPKFEVDQEKARQALNDLDFQLETLSKKQINPPKIKASSLANLKVQMREAPPEITGSMLGYLAFILFAFSIFYNILFATVIKPYVDGPDDITVANVSTTEASVDR